MLKKIIKILRNILIVILALLIIISIVGQVRKYLERNDVKPLGVLVNVNGKKMHVYSEGHGKKTIVLMPGLGSIAPSIDFKPLINELKKEFKVVVVEPFGYGFSEETSKERRVENIAYETRSALKKAKIEGPYILMPHSISGVYAQYYASIYPKEVESIVMLDTTLVKACLEDSDKVDLAMGKKQLILATLGNFLGIDRMYYNSIYKNENGFSESDKKKLVKMGVKNPFNKTMKNEVDMILKNCETVNKSKMPKDLPIFKFVAIKSVKDINKEKYTKIMNKNISEFKEYTKFRYSVLEGGHYIYYTKSKDIVKETREFLAKYDN
ncbi:alpha/beta hydrolase [Clostridium sporogenes]|uniref:alpha/beta fold hydrolase n=1 Tax=Clostridium sporogenes TaxID=1509 RepID=UPI0013D778DD|nr:alpha/beta hydrolase [Clostridium sporogenes]MCW6060222.1 alpha/beta hydrolase [Clostridium sporogenes]MCW6068134.1 alpha/beta hydrolase [Clostridium sporogenes]NFF66472.1 alpha/beta hydrolase [Clostridium sporogenes]NFF99654.1 alpha/beta hydrolase [Clostridium sporogenes]NFG05720.1 alpha/beta hydrolase [Clostridium sporogenes]